MFKLTSLRVCSVLGLAGMLSLLFQVLPLASASTVHQDIATFNRMIEATPSEASLYHGRGDAYLYLKEWRKAEADYSRALQLKPDNANALYSRGLANSCLNKTHCALMDFGKTLTLQPKDADAHYNRGLVRVKEGDIPGALFDYTRAIELNPQHAYAFYNRGMLYGLWPKRKDLALADLQKAEAAWPLNAFMVLRCFRPRTWAIYPAFVRP
jgi:tetratricopeptide (TPR) repeat protein